MTRLVYNYDYEHVVFTAETPSPGYFRRIRKASTPSPNLVVYSFLEIPFFFKV